jgi:hypothetical protein
LFSTSPSSSSLASATSSNISNTNLLNQTTNTPPIAFDQNKTFRNPFTNYFQQQNDSHNLNQEITNNNQQQQFNRLNNNNHQAANQTGYDADDEKRPDFYDDMFS